MIGWKIFKEPRAHCACNHLDLPSAGKVAKSFTQTNQDHLDAKRFQLKAESITPVIHRGTTSVVNTCPRRWVKSWNAADVDNCALRFNKKPRKSLSDSDTSKEVGVK